MGSRVTFDDHSHEAEALILAALRDGGSDATEYVLEESNRTVPIEESTLERSGTAEFDDASLTGTISYDTPYAAAQHEHTEFRHDAGRRAKWLELTLVEQAAAVRTFIADRVRKALG